MTRTFLLCLLALGACSPPAGLSLPAGADPTAPPPVGPAAGFAPPAPTAIDAGVLHGCALRSEGRAVCWGYNGHGQLGDGTRLDRLAPRLVKGVEAAIAVAVGWHHSCALTRDGRVLCWGGNDLGQIGDGGEGVVLTPTPVAGLDGVVQLDARGDHSCALRRDGTVVCWGSNYSGVLGDGTSEHRRRPVLVRQLSDAVEIAVGWSHSCARRRDGAVLCWGESHRGELGEARVEPGSLARVGDLEGVARLALGEHHSCALLASGGVKCWGENRDGQLGAGYRGAPGGGDETQVPRPVSVVGLSDAVEIGIGSDTSCARRDSGAVVCWGANRWGELGGATAEEVATRPMAIATIDDAVRLAIGGGFGCAERMGGALWCWGETGHGQLGVAAEKTHRETLAQAPLEVAGGEAHACLRDARGKVFCWGTNAWGQLGIGHNAPQRGMVEVPGLKDVVGLAAGRHHTCALLQSKEVWCWGDDRRAKGHVEHRHDGERSVYLLVDGKADPRMNAPVKLQAVNDAVDLSAAEGRSCITRSDGEVLCWHAADGSVAAVQDLDDVVEAVTGAAHSCARLRDGTVRCWGSNFYGRLGDGSNEERDKPVKVVRAEGGILDRVVELAAGRLHSCARRESGEVACWGTNSSGQLGDGTVMERNAAVSVVGLRDAVELHAGLHHSCARHGSGRVSCWGAGGEGQLGDGTRHDRLVPTEVIELRGALSLSGGSEYSCAATNSAVVCWGKVFGEPAARPKPSPPRAFPGWR